MTNEMLTQTRWILSFDSPLAEAGDLSLAGGKGANLARLARAGFPVPGGFLVSTLAYRAFVAENGLEERILAALPPADSRDAAALEDASRRIRALFQAGRVPPDLAAGLAAAYRQMGEPPVAVRSSATAEDLPELSFAGQQDTYLNVQGVEALLQAVVDCWASLWTARAIGYRARNGVPQRGGALAVVVQRMVESQVSGVLFTANPLSGLRTQAVIDAAFGLGEALVSGRVEPDHYVVDTARGVIVEKTLGAKALSVHGQAGGGTRQQETARGDQQALPDPEILRLARLGQRVAAEYGAPQDIEWAWAGGELYLLQSRAITSLYPTPEGVPPEPLNVFFSFAAVQGLLDPITPLGRDVLKAAFAMGARLFGIRVTAETQTVIFTAGERLWVNITTPFRNTVGRRVLHGALGMIEPSVRQALLTLWDEPALLPARPGIRPRARAQIARFLLPAAGHIFLNLLAPRRRREGAVAGGERMLALMRARAAAIEGAPRERLVRLAGLFPELTQTRLPRVLLRFVSVVAAAMASFNFVRLLARPLLEGPDGPAWNDLLLELTRGLPHNPTTEMDLHLWAVARAIQRDPELMAEFSRHDAPALAARYRAGALPPAGQALVDGFMERYGGRGLAEIDLGRPRWREEPAHVFEVLSSYLQIDRPELAPDVVFARGASAAQQALDRLLAGLRGVRGGWLRAALARFFAGRMRELMGARESPKFFAVRLFGLLRDPILRAGEELAGAGELERADDLFFLTFRELEAFAAREPRDWRALIAGRREANHREAMRRQVPRLLLSDGRAFYEGIAAPAAGENALHGSPVSPGRAEGIVRVVLDPRQANLKPGEILVCPGTDPSWTPLFLSAAGLVMEVGGMMTHGAVVAREYGIPAIVGVDQATRRLQTGQRIRIDGSTGVIELVEP